MKRVAIIGGGWAGCAALVHAAHAGYKGDLYEAARTLGGRARAVEVAGKTLDNGQHILLGAYVETLRTIRLAGGDVEHLFLRLPLSLIFPGVFELRAPRWPAPLHLLGALLRAQGLDASDRWGAIHFMATRQLLGFTLAQDMTVQAFLDENGQTPNAIRYLWEPLCIAALNTHIAQASAQVYLNVLRDSMTRWQLGPALASDMLIPRVDLTSAFPALAQSFGEAHGARIFTGHAVKSVTQSGSSWMVDGNSYDRVILAVAPQHASALLESLPETAANRALIDALDYEPITTCYLQYPASTTLPAPMIGMLGEVSQWAFDRGALDGQAEHAGLIAVVVSASGRQLELGNEEIARRIDAELRDLLPGLPAPEWSRIINEKRATFRCAPNVQRPGPQSGLPGLLLAGDYLASPYPATLEAAVRSAQAAVTLLQ